MRLLALCAVVVMAGCAQHAPVKPLTAPTYAEGFADGKALIRKQLPRSTYCDTRRVKLPASGAIKQIEYMRALRRSERRRAHCAQKHRSLINRLSKIRNVRND